MKWKRTKKRKHFEIWENDCGNIIRKFHRKDGMLSAVYYFLDKTWFHPKWSKSFKDGEIKLHIWNRGEIKNSILIGKFE